MTEENNYCIFASPVGDNTYEDEITLVVHHISMNSGKVKVCGWSRSSEIKMKYLSFENISNFYFSLLPDLNHPAAAGAELMSREKAREEAISLRKKLDKITVERISEAIYKMGMI